MLFGEELKTTLSKIDTKLGKMPSDLGSVSAYVPQTEEERYERSMIIDHFSKGYITMNKPRNEFNQRSVIQRLTVDKMNFNVYLPNDGEPNPGDPINGWRSNAARPTVRNKVMSIAGHATANLIYPRINAFNQESESQSDAAKVMRYLIEWAAEQSDYPMMSLKAVVTALFSPASIVHTQYQKVWRQVKRPKDGGGYDIDIIEDTALSGFQDTPVPVDELFIENPFQEDIQLQGWLCWRRVLSYSTAETLYRDQPNFKYVKPGMQTIYSDPNQLFYDVYDSNLRGELVEEVRYYNRQLDIYQVLVNTIPMYPAGNPNPRYDKRYPFIKFGYERLDEGRFFYYKSLASKLKQDADIIDQSYRMMIDGGWLQAMPPTVTIGPELIGADVMVPGTSTTLSQNADIKNLVSGANLGPNVQALQEIQADINDTTQEWELPQAKVTAYQISAQQQQALTFLGSFMQMIGDFVKQYGHLRVGDILQYLTLVDVDQITDDAPLVYKTFNKTSTKAGESSKRIKFDSTLPMGQVPKTLLDKLSFDTLKSEGADQELFRVNPEIFRSLNFMLQVVPDDFKPMTADLERAYRLEIYDRAIANPSADPEKLFTDFLLGGYADLVSDPEQYVRQQQPVAPGMTPNGPMPGGLPGMPQMSSPTMKQQLKPTVGQ